MRVKRIAFFVFPRLTLMDLVGGYDALRRVARMGIDRTVTHRIVGTEPELADDSGFVLRPDDVYEDLEPYDLLYVPGGVGVHALLEDARALEYLASWGPEKPIASVATGSLLLGAAGHLTGLRATTHHDALEQLAPYCVEVSRDRIVDEGRVVTAGGATRALDLGIHLVRKLWGAEAAFAVARQMEYQGSLSSR
jgi:transcriptional regulator GlxA family with amidase domain